MHILVLISVFITVKSMDTTTYYSTVYEDSDAWTDFDQNKGIGSAFNDPLGDEDDTVLPFHGPENEKGQRSLQSGDRQSEERKPASVHIQNNIGKMEFWLQGNRSRQKIQIKIKIFDLVVRS